MDTETQPIKKGIVFKTDGHGKIVVCLHPDTMTEWLKTLPKDKKGWTQFKLIPNKNPERGITHRLVADFYDFQQRETKPDNDFETK